MKIANLLPCLAITLWLAASAPEARGQAANDNPTGPAGWFNGNITSAGSYDPLTGSMARTVTDLTIAGAVGEYGLSYSRTWNSRADLGGWRHSYKWAIQEVIDLPAGYPVPYACL